MARSLSCVFAAVLVSFLAIMTPGDAPSQDIRFYDPNLESIQALNASVAQDAVEVLSVWTNWQPSLQGDPRLIDDKELLRAVLRTQCFMARIWAYGDMADAVIKSAERQHADDVRQCYQNMDQHVGLSPMCSDIMQSGNSFKTYVATLKDAAAQAHAIRDASSLQARNLLAAFVKRNPDEIRYVNVISDASRVGYNEAKGIQQRSSAGRLVSAIVMGAFEGVAWSSSVASESPLAGITEGMAEAWEGMALSADSVVSGGFATSCTQY